jgi:hypothetical protein
MLEVEPSASVMRHDAEVAVLASDSDMYTHFNLPGRARLPGHPMGETCDCQLVNQGYPITEKPRFEAVSPEDGFVTDKLSAVKRLSPPIWGPFLEAAGNVWKLGRILWDKDKLSTCRKQGFPFSLVPVPRDAFWLEKHFHGKVFVCVLETGGKGG